MSEVAGPRRLRELLDAVLALGSDLDPPSILRRIIEAAVGLVDARYGALGVLDDTGTGLARFITVGIDDVSYGLIGDLPQGHGILGRLIVDAEPLRLPDLREHPDSFGFPPHHPPMRSFLGIPIRVRGQVFGNLYLTDKTTAEVFTDVDEELVVPLAASAGIAIDNARLHTRVQKVALTEDRERIVCTRPIPCAQGPSNVNDVDTVTDHLVANSASTPLFSQTLVVDVRLGALGDFGPLDPRGGPLHGQAGGEETLDDGAMRVRTMRLRSGRSDRSRVRSCSRAFVAARPTCSRLWSGALRRPPAVTEPEAYRVR